MPVMMANGKMTCNMAMVLRPGTLEKQDIPDNSGRARRMDVVDLTGKTTPIMKESLLMDNLKVAVFTTSQTNKSFTKANSE